MKLREYLNGVDIFGLIEDARSFPFLQGETQVLSDLLTTFHGEKTLFPAMEGKTPETAAKFIALQFGDNWTALVIQNALKENPGKLREIEETRAENRNTTSASTNQVSGFNSSTMVDDTGTNGVEDVEADTNRLLTDKETDARAVFDFLSAATQSSIISTVLHNVAAFLTLSVYNRG